MDINTNADTDEKQRRTLRHKIYGRYDFISKLMSGLIYHKLRLLVSSRHLRAADFR